MFEAQIPLPADRCLLYKSYKHIKAKFDEIDQEFAKYKRAVKDRDKASQQSVQSEITKAKADRDIEKAGDRWLSKVRTIVGDQ